jgi:predicted TIM-barrel enzyme
VFADIKKKHAAHAITADVDLEETATSAEFFQADSVIISGAVTGRPTDPVEVRIVSQAVGIPALAGSGVTPENMGSRAAAAYTDCRISCKRADCGLIGLTWCARERCCRRLDWNGPSI